MAWGFQTFELVPGNPAQSRVLYDDGSTSPLNLVGAFTHNLQSNGGAATFTHNFLTQDPGNNPDTVVDEVYWDGTPYQRTVTYKMNSSGRYFAIAVFSNAYQRVHVTSGPTLTLNTYPAPSSVSISMGYQGGGKLTIYVFRF